MVVKNENVKIHPQDKQTAREAYRRAIDPNISSEQALANIQHICVIFEKNSLSINSEFEIEGVIDTSRDAFDKLTQNRALDAATEEYAKAKLLIDSNKNALTELSKVKKFAEIAAVTIGLSLKKVYEDHLDTTQNDFEALLKEHDHHGGQGAAVNCVVDNGVPAFKVS